MAESKDAKSQEVRIKRLASEAERQLRAVYDVESDRVKVRLDGREVASFGPKEWFMSDDELRQKLANAIIDETR